MLIPAHLRTAWRESRSDDGDTGVPSGVDPSRFRARMQSSDFASELFVPPSLGTWKAGRFRLKRDRRREAKSDISGVRLQPYDRTGADRTLERQCQLDVTGLIASLKKLRAETGLENLVLDGEVVRMRQPLGGGRARVKFGLACREGTGTSREEAARTCHRRIVRAVHRAGLVVEHPRRFDPKEGLDGLERWGGELRLRRRRVRWPWLLLLLLLLPLLGVRDCGPSRFFGVAIDTSSLVVIIDKSGSMESVFPLVREEAKRTLGRMRAGWLSKRYANVITYTGTAESALGGLAELDAASAERLTSYLERLTPGGDTNLGPALELAAHEVAAHGRPTTLVILTDGQGDGSIAAALEDPALLSRFHDVEVIGHTLSPRLLTDEGRRRPAPAGADEENLRRLAERLNGGFGPFEDAP